MKLEEEAAALIRRRAAQKKQRYRTRQRGKTADPRDGNRPQMIQIWVCDPQAWRAIHGVEDRASLVGITEAEIFKQCKRYRNTEVDEVWNSIGPDYQLEERVKPLPSTTAANPMTEEQDELAYNDFMSEAPEISLNPSSLDPDARHIPNTGGGRRVTTRHNPKRDR